MRSRSWIDRCRAQRDLSTGACRPWRGGALALLWTLAGLATPGWAVTIDTFSTNQAVLSAPPDSSSSVAGSASDPIGSRRGLAVRNLTGAGPTTVQVTSGNLVLNVAATTPDSRGRVLMSWDGDTNATGFRLAFASSTVVSEVEITVYDSAADSSQAARRIPVLGAPTNIFIPFSEFRVASGTGAIFSSVGAIEVVLRSGEGSVTLNEISTAATALAATKVDIQTLDTDGDLRVDPGDRVRYTITITNSGNEALNVDLLDTVDPNSTLVAGSVSSSPIARNDQYGWFGNVNFATNGAARPHLLANDGDADGDTVTVEAASFPASTAAGGTLTLVDSATGAFSYGPPAGFSGVDSFIYSILDDDGLTSTATAYLLLDGVVWFVDDSNTTAPFLGTQTDPFQSFAAVNGVGDSDSPGDLIFLFEDDGTPYAGGFMFEADQALIGEASGLVLGGVTIVSPGGTPAVTNAGGTGITLATDNSLSGVTVTGSSGAGIVGSAFATFAASGVDVTTAGGAALDLANGTLSATFGTLSSAGTAGQRGLSLVSIAGSLSATTTSLTNPTTDGIFVSGSGAGTFQFGATSVTDSNSAAAPIADGVDVATSNSGATFQFASLSVTADDGVGLRANASGTLQIGGSSNSIVSNGGPAVDIASTNLGSGATFANLTSTNSSGKGVNLDSVSGAFTANGGSISGPAGIGFDLNGGSSTVTYAGALSNTANAPLIEVTSRSAGVATFSGTLSSTASGDGIRVSSNSAGSVQFTGSSKVLTTGADTAVHLASNTGASIHFTGGGLAITTTTGAGFNAIGGASAVTVQGVSNTVTTTTGTALNVSATTIGASGLTFQRISQSGGANAIVLSSPGSTGGLTVTGTGASDSGGILQNLTADAVLLSGATGVSLSEIRITNAGANALDLSNVTGLTLSGVDISVSTLEAIKAVNLTNLTMIGGSVHGGAIASEPTCNIHGIEITNLLGASTITGTTFSRANTVQFRINNNANSGVQDTLTLSGTTWRDHNGPCGGDHLSISSDTGGNFKVITNGTAGENNFGAFSPPATQGGGSPLNLAVNNAGILEASLTAIDASNTTTGVAIGSGTGATGRIAFDVYDNRTALGTGFASTGSVALIVSCISGAGGVCEGAFRNNTIAHTAGTSTNAMQVVVEGNGTGRVRIENNVVSGNFQRGLHAQSRLGTGALSILASGNTFTQTDAGGLQVMNL